MISITIISVLTRKCSLSVSDHCHSDLDRIPMTTNPKATMRIPRELANFASTGREEYGSPLLQLLVGEMKILNLVSFINVNVV